MFAPHHQTAADRLVRVCRTGGTIGLAAWTPSGFIGQMFATMKPYAAPPPPGAQPHRCGALKITYVSCSVIVSSTYYRNSEPVRITHFAAPEEFRDYFKTNYGPTIAAYRGLADDPDRVEALDRDLAALARRFDQGADSHVVDWEYLLFVCRKR